MDNDDYPSSPGLQRNAGERLNGPGLQGNPGRATFAIRGAVTSIWELPSGPERVHRAHVIPLEAASIGPAPVIKRCA